MPENGDIVIVRNRTDPLRPLPYEADRRTYVLAQRDNPILYEHVRFAKAQNPIMGALEDEADVRLQESLVGIVAPEGEKQKDPIGLVGVTDAIERIARSPDDHVIFLRGRAQARRSSLNRRLTQEERTDYLPADHFPPIPVNDPRLPADMPARAATAPPRKKSGRPRGRPRKHPVPADAPA